MRICDLHTHSVFSDGTCTPEEIITSAAKAGLCAVALTDHNSVDGIPRFMRAACGTPVRAVSGAEFSTDYKDGELHILGLFIEEQHFPAVGELVSVIGKNKEASNRQLAADLTVAGYPIDLDKIKASTPAGHVNRVHFAASLIEGGYVKDINEAFDTLLSPSQGYYIPPKRLPVFDVISFIRSIGAVPVLAHPFLNLNEQELREFLPEAIKAGLIGMETMYSAYDKETARLAADIAEEYGLRHSGGSDFHGSRKPDIALGIGRGELAVPLDFLDKLYEMRKQ